MAETVLTLVQRSHMPRIQSIASASKICSGCGHHRCRRYLCRLLHRYAKHGQRPERSLEIATAAAALAVTREGHSFDSVV